MLTSKSLLQHTFLYKTSLLPTTQALLLGSCSTPQRTYMLQWLPKYRDHYKPKWFNNPIRRNDSQLKNRKHMYFDSDPLHFEHKQFWINGGIKTVSSSVLPF